MVGFLCYLTCTRQDILYGVELISRLIEELIFLNLLAVKWIFCYIKVVCDALWQRNLLKDLYFAQDKPTVTYTDNKLAIALSKNLVYHERNKHIDTRYHFIWKQAKYKKVELIHVKP